MKNNEKKIAMLIFIIIVTEIVGMFSGLLAGDIRQIYDGLNKIPLSPPGVVFGIVWPLLYLLMSLSLYLTFTSCENKKEKKKVIYIYGVQLFFNFSWSIIFFNIQYMKVAILIVVFLLFMVGYQITIFSKNNKLAGYLLVPYWLWLLFATYLNVGFALIN
ncbi:tryptophan-rich sensory protein [Enterococcus asini]|uniref:Tryptophan-rich sensory protein n=2 Tax=Enterococcus TaxID=1350 RepID=A0ABD5FDR5_ENTAV|nr:MULTISPECIES: TspO/MBR family protein [Enterococcus]MDK4353371.1 tryptophan-rich sensory protein [Enterococcus thailandicus]MDT2386999.1 tryptophan-rich sensory protein [Enterococcus avium]MDT2516461.1 tryptophan-rich sensory protein [Enterococcus avium]MDT2574026.1 tryptophan-rich sensory protein [Enterococcus raffinosus]MDT2638173.1 tryptophan-rich sensory protein [Enterococcus dongliensis]